MITPLEFAISSLLRKRQSEAEMRKKLKSEFPQADHEGIITRLKELKYLDDQAFLEAYLRNHEKQGMYVLKRKLLQKGVSKEVIDACLVERNESEILESLAKRQWEKVKEMNLMKKKAKVSRFLIGRGFAIQDVYEIVNVIARSPAKRDDEAIPDV